LKLKNSFQTSEISFTAQKSVSQLKNQFHSSEISFKPQKSVSSLLNHRSKTINSLKTNFKAQIIVQSQFKDKKPVPSRKITLDIKIFNKKLDNGAFGRIIGW